jgi:uncharacterized membrane protein
MTTANNGTNDATPAQQTPSISDWSKLKLPPIQIERPPIKNANQEHQSGLSPLDKLAVAITDKVGSMGFFFIILVWTVGWCGYNILASEVTGLHWKSFDPFPAFVAYLLISNVIQIFLMPLIMVGQNVQGKHSEIRAELDFEINQKAEKEVMAILQHLEHNTDLLLKLMEHLECRVSDEEIRAITAEKELAEQLEHAKPGEAKV